MVIPNSFPLPGITPPCILNDAEPRRFAIDIADSNTLTAFAGHVSRPEAHLF